MYLRGRGYSFIGLIWSYWNYKMCVIWTEDAWLKRKMNKCLNHIAQEAVSVGGNVLHLSSRLNKPREISLGEWMRTVQQMSRNYARAKHHCILRSYIYHNWIAVRLDSVLYSSFFSPFFSLFHLVCKKGGEVYGNRFSCTGLPQVIDFYRWSEKGAGTNYWRVAKCTYRLECDW